MGAIFGIFGECNKFELEKIGASLAHRGEIGSSWTVHPTMHFGVRMTGQSNNELFPPNDPIAYDGMIDISKKILSDLKCEDHDSTISHIIYKLYRKMGTKGFGFIRAPFAIALWDERIDTLILASDPLGIKMLYYAKDSYGRYIFASEYKALLALDPILTKPDRNAIQYVYRTKFATPHGTCIAGIKSVSSGCCVKVNKSETRSERYYNINIDIARRSEREHAKVLLNDFLMATKRLTSNFEKFGIALSVGIDSVALLAAARRVAPEKEIHTFTVGINATDNYQVEAKKVAEQFKAIHHPIIIKSNDLPELMKNTLWRMEEPTGREERILYYSVAEEAVKHVPMVLTGQTSDSIFGGMPRHLVVNIAFRLPFFRGPIADFYNYSQMGAIPSTLVGKALVAIYYKKIQLKQNNVIGAMSNISKKDLKLNSHQPLNEYLISGLFYGKNTTYATEKIFDGAGVKVMSPFQDIDFMRTAFQIPDRLKIKGFQQKYILVSLLKDLLPKNLWKRKKDFMRIIKDKSFCDCLENIANELLASATVRERGLFDANFINKLKFRRKNKIYTMEEFYDLWSLILIEMWCRIFLDNRGKRDIKV